jgi:hypothetical protein
VDHVPWPIRPARAEFGVNTLAAPFGVGLNGPPAHLAFVDLLDVFAWRPYRNLTTGVHSPAP